MSRLSGLATRLRSHAAAFRERRRRRLLPESQVRVGYDDREIVCSYPEGVFRSVAWSDLSEVRIRTTSEGPFFPDVFWVLEARGAADGIVYPQGAVGDAKLLEALQRRLEGFDNGAVIRAMGCAIDAVFVVWTRRPAT